MSRRPDRTWSIALCVAVAIHVEFASSQSPDAALTLQARNHAVFATAHADWLAGQCARADGVLRARNRPHDRTRLLYIDDMLPDSSWGSGFPRAVEFLRAIASRYAVTVFATRADARRDQLGGFLDIETIEGLGGERLGAFLADRRGVFDLIIVSRSHNMEFLRAAFPNLGELGIPVIYDAEAINALRDVLQARVLGSPLSPHAEAARVRDEILLADGCPLVLAVSELERKRFAEHGHRTRSFRLPPHGAQRLLGP